MRLVAVSLRFLARLALLVKAGFGDGGILAHALHLLGVLLAQTLQLQDVGARAPELALAARQARHQRDDRAPLLEPLVEQNARRATDGLRVRKRRSGRDGFRDETR